MTSVRSMVWAEMGSGKTAAGLFTASHLLKHQAISGALVLGPLRVVQSVWEQEARQWRDLKDLKFALLHGDKLNAERLLAARNHHIYLCNYEMLGWLSQVLVQRFLRYGHPPPFSLGIFDEVTRLKSMRDQGGGRRAKALRTFIPHLQWRIGLTGTPAPNGLLDLFGQYLALDGGYRLGTSIQACKERWFRPADYQGFKHVPTEQGAQEIYHRIADITFQLTADEQNRLPTLDAPNDIEFELPPDARSIYRDMERQLFAEFQSLHHARPGQNVEVEAANRGVLQNKCLQICSGAVYPIPDMPDYWEPIHDSKLQVLDEIIDETGNTPLLVGYAYKHEAQRIFERYKNHLPMAFLGGPMSVDKTNQIIQAWNNKQLKLLIGHPQSIGHGLNLQFGSYILVLMSLVWSLEYYRQMIARLHRQGQTERVKIFRIIARDTVEKVPIEALIEKERVEQELQIAVRRLRAQGCPEHQIQAYEGAVHIPEDNLMNQALGNYLYQRHAA